MVCSSWTAEYNRAGRRCNAVLSGCTSASYNWAVAARHCGERAAGTSRLSGQWQLRITGALGGGVFGGHGGRDKPALLPGIVQAGCHGHPTFRGNSCQLAWSTQKRGGLRVRVLGTTGLSKGGQPRALQLGGHRPLQHSVQALLAPMGQTRAWQQRASQHSRLSILAGGPPRKAFRPPSAKDAARSLSGRGLSLNHVLFPKAPLAMRAARAAACLLCLLLAWSTSAAAQDAR